MTRAVVVTDPDVWPHLREALARAGSGELVPRFVPWQDRTRVHEALGEAWAYVGVFFDAAAAAAVGGDLRLVQITAAGTEHTAVGLLPPEVHVANAFGHERSVAEHVVMVVLALRRHLLAADRGMRGGTWATRLAGGGTPGFANLDGSTMGIVGFGHIGRAVARVCAALGMRVVAIRGSAHARLSTDPDAAWVGGPAHLADLLRESRTVVLACPLDDRTTGLIGRRELELLGPEGILVNVSRGAVTDEDALYTALRDHLIAGAAVDTWYRPVSDRPGRFATRPFHELDNVVMTPHCSATAAQTYPERAAIVADNLARVLAGSAPGTAVTRTPPAGTA